MLLTSMLSDEDLYLFNEGTHVRLYEKLGAHPAKNGYEPATEFAVWAPNAERVSVMGDFNDWSKTSHPLENHGVSGIWEGALPRRGAGRPIQVPHRFAIPRLRSGQDRSLCVLRRVVAADGVRGLGPGLRLAGRPLDGRAGGRRQSLQAPMAIYEVHLGSWMRCPDRGEALLLLSGHRGRIGPVRRGPRLHPRGVPAADGAPLLRLLGLSDDRLLCADQPLWDAARLDVPDRLPAPARHRRDPRLGALALHHRRARTGLFRRHAPLRTRRSAAGSAPDWHSYPVQLRPQRGPRLPA